MATFSDSPQSAEIKPIPQRDMAYLEGLLTRLGLRTTQVRERAILILESLQKSGLLKACELQAKSKLGKSSFYHIINFLKRWGFIRKESVYWKLNSKFSANCIDDASFWIEFAGIVKNQPTLLDELIMNLIRCRGIPNAKT